MWEQQQEEEGARRYLLMSANANFCGVRIKMVNALIIKKQEGAGSKKKKAELVETKEEETSKDAGTQTEQVMGKCDQETQCEPEKKMRTVPVLIKRKTPFF